MGARKLLKLQEAKKSKLLKLFRARSLTGKIDAESGKSKEFFYKHAPAFRQIC
jgi:hypothetical protein